MGEDVVTQVRFGSPVGRGGSFGCCNGYVVRFDWNIDRRVFSDALARYDTGREIGPLAELVNAVQV